MTVGDPNGVSNNQMDVFLTKISAKAEGYYRRGRDSESKGRAKTLDEAIDIIEKSCLQVGFELWAAEGVACILAKCYIAGVEAEKRKDIEPFSLNLIV